MEITLATEKQVALFKQGAASKYLELGIPADAAEELFASAMDKLAEDLGIIEKDASSCGSAKPVKKKAKKSDKIEKLASSIAASVGRTRKI